MKTFFKGFKNEFKGGKIFDITLIVVSSGLILGLGIGNKDSAIIVVAAVTGVIGVLLGAKGKISCFGVASINSVLYIIIAIQGGLLSTVILHAVFYIPMNVIGFILGLKRRNKSGDVLPKKLSTRGKLTAVFLLLIFYVSYSLIIHFTSNATNVGLDSAVFILTVVAIILMSFRFTEQGYLWLTTNIFSIALGTTILIQIEKNPDYTKTTAIIFIIQFLSSIVNSLYGLGNWAKLQKANTATAFFISVPNETYKTYTKTKKFSYQIDKGFTKHKK